MEDAAELLLSTLSKEEVVSRPILRFPQFLEILLEAGAISSDELDVIKHQLDSPETAPFLMNALCRARYPHLLRMALQHRQGLATQAVDSASSTPLHVASRHGQPAAVLMLLNAGADLEAVRDSDGWTALHEAAACGGIGGHDVARELLRSGARVDHKDKAGRTPLQLAEAAGNVAVTQLLTGTGTTAGGRDSSARLLLEVARESDKVAACGGSGGDDVGNAAVTQLPDSAAADTTAGEKDLSARLQLEAARDKDVCTAQHEAAVWPTRPESSQGPGPRKTSRTARSHCSRPQGAPELHSYLNRRLRDTAIYSAEGSTVGLPMLAEADVNVRDKHNMTALHRAADGGDVEAVRALLASGADRNCVDHRRRATPLHFAAAAGSASAVRLLLDGANIDARDAEGCTPLLYAARYTDSVATARALLAGGADPTARDEDGMTPLHWAALSDRVRIVRLLLRTTDVDVADDSGCTPLHCAALSGCSAVAKALLQAGADKTARNKHGNTAHDLSVGALKGLLK